MKSIQTLLQFLGLITALFFLSGCSEKKQNPETNTISPRAPESSPITAGGSNPGSSVTPTPSGCVPMANTFRDVEWRDANSDTSVNELSLEEGTLHEVRLRLKDSCQNDVAIDNSFQFTLDPTPYATLTREGARIFIRLTESQWVPHLTSIVIRAKKGPFERRLDAVYRNPIASIGGLIRWYPISKLGSFLQGTTFGESAHPLRDFSEKAYHATEGERGSGARLEKNRFKKPVLRFCGAQAGCGWNKNSALKIGNNHQDFSKTDLTIITVVARGNERDSSIINADTTIGFRGLFLGFPNKDEFRFGLNGFYGWNRLDAKVGSQQNQLQVMTARLNSENPDDEPGITLRRNGSVIARDSKEKSKINVTDPIPFLGSLKSSYRKSAFFLGDIMIFNRALSTPEIESVEKYLAKIYEIY